MAKNKGKTLSSVEIIEALYSEATTKTCNMNHKRLLMAELFVFWRDCFLYFGMIPSIRVLLFKLRFLLSKLPKAPTYPLVTIWFCVFDVAYLHWLTYEVIDNLLRRVENSSLGNIPTNI